jgi:hypothetical protein
MARPENEVRRKIQNMEKMGWVVRRTSNSTGFVVQRPGFAPVTINARSAGHGTGFDHVVQQLDRLGYDTAWADWLDAQRDHRLAAQTAADPTPSPATVFGDKPVTTTAPAEIGPVNRDLVDGVKVTDRTPAKLPTPLTNGKLRVVAGVDEIMLEDGRVLYQCVRSAFCAKTFETPLSARAHLTAHGGVRRAAREDKARRAAGTDRAAKSMAGQIGAETRRQRVALLIGDETRAAWLVELADQLEAAVPLLRELARHKVEAPAPPVDEAELAELRTKAARWDTFKAMTRD